MKQTDSPSQHHISRRAFLTATGGLTLGITAFALVPRMFAEDQHESATENLVKKQITAWVHIQANGQITIYSPAAEMGQGSLTALPIILAEELDADWAKVSVEQSPIDPDTYGFPGWGRGKRMITVGSITVMRYFDALRQAGAQARFILLNSVAEKWKVPISELSTEPNTVIHKSSGRKVDYGEITTFMSIPDDIPEIPVEKLKKPSDFRLIGKVDVRYELPEKVNGKAMFAMDVRLPGMVYGTIERGNVHGAAPTLEDEGYIREQPGVIDVVKLDYGIGIVTETWEAAMAIRKKLKINWSEDVTARGHSTEKAWEDYEKLANSNDKGRILNESGDFAGSSKSAAQVYQSDYFNEHVYHAQMEPLNAVASVSADGNSAEVWVGTQSAGSVKGAVSKALGIPEEKVTFHQHYLGGGFGRRSIQDSVIEAALLSKAVSRPVKVIWTREDDLRYGMYRPMSLQRMKAAVDAKGNLSGFSHTIVGDGSGLLASGARNEFYNIPHQHLELRSTETGLRLKHWRSVGHGPNKFAIEGFIDEIAADQRVDSYEFRRKLMKDHPRALATLEKVAEMSNWGSPVPEGRARGIAFGERSGALCSGVCELSVDLNTGKIKVHHFWVAVDAGIVIQPNNVEAQIEGGIIMGMSSVLTEKITVKNGEIQQSNYNDYPLLRIKDIPESIEIAIMPSEEAPMGIGEASTPLVGAAIANAFGALTGKRIRHMPFTPEQVLKVLG